MGIMGSQKSMCALRCMLLPCAPGMVRSHSSATCAARMNLGSGKVVYSGSWGKQPKNTRRQRNFLCCLAVWYDAYAAEVSPYQSQGRPMSHTSRASLLFLTVSVYCLLILPRMLSQGMFLDGVAHASIARN